MMLLNYCAAFSMSIAAAAYPPDAPPVTEATYQDHEQPSLHQWVGRTDDAGRIAVLLQWLELGYSDYDIMQSSGYFQDRFSVIGRMILRISNENAEATNHTFHEVRFTGTRLNNELTLHEDPIPGSVDFEADVLDSVLDATRQWNDSHSKEHAPLHVLHFDASGSDEQDIRFHIRLHMLKPLSHLAPEGEKYDRMRISRLDESSMASWKAWAWSTPTARVWNGEIREVGKSELRLFLIGVPSSMRETERGLFLGWLKSSRSVKRLLGPMPPDSVWTSRLQYVRFLQEVQDAMIEDFLDPESAQVIEEIAERSLGFLRPVQELHADAIRIFGSFDAAVDATCRLPETWHYPMFAVEHDGQFFAYSSIFDSDDAGIGAILRLRLMRSTVPLDEFFEVDVDAVMHMFLQDEAGETVERTLQGIMRFHGECK